MDGAARGSRGAHAVVRRRRGRVHPLRDRRRVRPRGAAARTPSSTSRPRRFTRRSCSATRPRSRRGCAITPRSRPQPGGPQDWEPLLYVCHTSLHRTAPARVDGLVRSRARSGARRKSQRRVSLELAPRAAAHGVVGRGVCRAPSAARRGAARGRRESHRWRHDAHCRRRRRYRRARPAARYGLERERHSRRRAAARLHDAVGGQSGGAVLAARTRRGRESRVGRRG